MKGANEMAAALGTFSAVQLSKPMRIEGHTSNVEGPIMYRQFGKVTIAETTESGDTYNLPHQITNPMFIGTQPVDAVAVTFLTACMIADSGIITNWTQTTTAEVVGATEVILTGQSAVNDVYNNLYLDLRFSDGQVQTVKITDYVGSTKAATLSVGIVKAIAATGTYFRIRGTLLTTTGAAATPTFKYEVIGTFD